MRISDFDYRLPESNIALYPPKKRGSTSLLVLNRQTGSIEHRLYSDITEYIEAGDVVILNNTRVIKARLQAVNYRNQPKELLLLERHKKESSLQHQALYRGKLIAGETLFVANTSLKVEYIIGDGIALISSSADLLELAARHGSVPLPPYLKREADQADTERYQTEFAKENGSVAAPTASLNFTNELAAKLNAKGVRIVYLTLHVGLGTFLPIRTDKVEAHKMHSEYFEIPAETIIAIQKAKASGNNIVAIGTTVARTLEYAWSCHPDLVSGFMPDTYLSGEANIFIYPGYQFKVIDSLVTNFHAPRSTVLMLAAAFSSWDNLKRAYEEALAKDYKFLSYGDSMLIINS